MEGLLTGQVALVTGGSAGIGKAIAALFAKQGAQVALFGTQKEKGDAAAREIEELSGQRALFFAVDVKSTSEVAAAVDQVQEQLGPIDILVNNAGVTRDGLLMKMSEEDFDLVIDTNLKSCFNTAKAVIRGMIKKRRGRIINVASVIGLHGNAGQCNYAASKGGMVAFTKSLAKEVASRNILVNCIAPGFIVTDMTKVLADQVQNSLLEKTPLGKMGRPEDIAKTALFLASDMSDFITGEVIKVDGGLFM
ncbi:MAG: 3-oxoacyl-ACP reductase [Chlamydiales bacterium]|jgi:3-oxoacyl-[acyl-carrier protein] reductase|nr:3-oxoacyl-ACP reductase [Chlamydiales bacterium]